MKRFLRWRCAITFGAVLIASPLVAQDDPDALMADAISLYSTAMEVRGEERYQRLQQVDDTLNRIRTEFPDSAPASVMQLGIPLGPIDLNMLEAELAAGETKIAGRLSGEMAEYWEILQERSPEVAATVEETLKKVLGSTVDEAKDELYVKSTYYIMAAFYYASETAFDHFFDPTEAGQLYKVFVGAGGLEELGDIGASTVEDIAVGVALDFASSTLADFAVQNGPEMSDATRSLVRVALKATISETILAIQAYKDPSKIPGLGIKRVSELIEIITTTRGLAADVDRALAQTALRMQTMAQLTASYRDQERVQNIISSTRKNLVVEIEGAVGKDDAKAVSDTMLRGWAALTAEFEGETERAQELHKVILLRGNVDNMPTIWNAPDLLTYFANGFTDSPKRAAEIMVGLTELSKYSKATKPMEAVTTPSTNSELANTQIAPEGFLGPEVDTLDAAYIERAKDRFLSSFAQMCALPSVLEAGVACPVVEKTCEGTGCVSRGPMRALETVQLFTAPNDTRVVATMNTEDWGFNELERTWFAPCKSIVTETYESDARLPAVGTSIWKLKETGEGYSKFHWPGNGVIDFIGSYTESRSGAPSQKVDPCFDGNREAWALMTTAEGKRGWYRPQRQFSGSNSIDINHPLENIPQWLKNYQEQQADVSATDNPFPLVLQNPFETTLNSAVQQPSNAPNGIPDQAASGSGWSMSDGLTKLIVGVQASDALVSANNAVTVFGRQALPPVNATNPPDTTVAVALDGEYREVFQTVSYSDGWDERVALVPRDSSKRTFAISPDGVFRFSRGVAWSNDGRFALVQYDYDEFASDGLLVELASGASARIKSDRQDVLHSNISLRSIKDLGNGIHSVDFSHLNCPLSHPNCGMATAEDAGTTTVKFRVPEAPASGEASSAASQIAMFDALPNGTYGIDASMCARKDENFRDAVYKYFRYLDRPDLGDRYDQGCSIVGRSESDGAVMIDLACNAEGNLYDDMVRWRIQSPTSFTDLDAFGGPKNFQLCDRVDEPPEKALSREWTKAIAISPDSISRDCYWSATTQCLREGGASNEAITFHETVVMNHESGPMIFASGFDELGKVDIVTAQTGTNRGSEQYLINTNRDGLVFPSYYFAKLSEAAQYNPVARALLAQFPGSVGWHQRIEGMRNLPNGHQRFTLATHYSEGCRACPVIGQAIVTVDYDGTGRERAYSVKGVIDLRRTATPQSANANSLKAYPKLVQYFLNVRGYDAGPMDGALGPRSRKAIADFQRENGINNGTEQLNEATLAALVDRETMFSNGYEGAFTSTQQEEVASSEFPGCADPGRKLTTSEIIDLYSGATMYDDLGRLTRYEVISGEDTWVKQYGVPLGKETQSILVGVRNAKICFIESDHEFCNAVSICNSNDAEYILTPNGGGEARYITKVEPGTKQPASCSSPDSLLTKAEILATLAGKKLDTRPGGNRYVLQSFSEYDSERDRGTVTLSDDRGSFEQAYFVSDGELCTQNLSGGSRYCEQVRRCDYEGSGPKIGFFDGDRLSTHVGEVFAIGESYADSAPINGPHTAPDGYKWLQLASRPDLEAARDFAAEVVHAGGGARIFQTSNGWFAITATSPHPMFVGNEEENLSSLRSVSWIPGDAFFVEGESYVTEFPIKKGDEVTPAFTTTTTNRDTPMLALDTLRGEWTEGEIVRAGDSIIVWGTPNLETGNCLISGHEGVWVACAHTVAFENSAPPATSRAPTQNELTTEDFYRMFEANNGDNSLARLVGATRWKDTPEQRASLLLVVEAAISRDEEYTATRKASILLSVMHEASKLAGGDGELFRIMNYARNSKNGEHPSIGTVLERGSSWKEANDKAKEFHIIGYDNPDDVRKFTHPDGREAVFFRNPQTDQWEIMHDGTNDATYNLVNGSLTSRNDFYQHMLLDVVPWIVYGVSPEDKTSFKDRLEAFEQSGPLAVATRLYPFFTKTGAELTSEVLEELPSQSQMTGPLQAWLLYKGQTSQGTKSSCSIIGLDDCSDSELCTRAATAQRGWERVRQNQWANELKTRNVKCEALEQLMAVIKARKAPALDTASNRETTDNSSICSIISISACSDKQICDRAVRAQNLSKARIVDNLYTQEINNRASDCGRLDEMVKQISEMTAETQKNNEQITKTVKSENLSTKGYPEFNGVYVGISGEYIQLTEASINTLQITEVGYERCPRSFCPGSPGGIEGYRNFAGIAAYIQLQTVSTQQVLSSASVPQNFESIFVRNRSPQENIFYSYVVKYNDFMRTTDGQLLDEKERPLGAAIFDRRREAGLFKYTTTARQSRLSNTYVLGDCGWDTSAFNVKIIDNTAIEFFFKYDISTYRSPLVERCGKDNTVETRSMAFRLGDRYYIVNLEPPK